MGKQESGMLKQYHRQPIVYIHGADGHIDLSRFVQSISTQKSIDRPVSSCSITLVNSSGATPQGNNNLFMASYEWLSFIKKVVRPQQVISIQLFPKEEEKETFIGLIDVLNDNESYEGGQPSISYSFSAAGLLGKILTKEAIVGSQILAMFTNPELEQALGQSYKDFFNMVRGLTDKGGSFFIGNPDTGGAIKYILSNAIRFREFIAVNPDGIAQLIPFNIGTENEESLNQILDLQVLKYEYLFGVELSTYTGSIWNYLLRTLDTRFYETFIDTTLFTIKGITTTREKVVIRPIPFSYRFMDEVYETSERDKRLQENWGYWEDLPVTASYTKRDIINKNMSISDSQHFNWFTMNYNNSIIAPPGSSLATFGYSSPLINVQGIKEFGLRELQYETKNPFNFEKLQKSYQEADKNGTAVNFSQEEESVLHLNLQSKKNRIMEWFSFPYYENGQISVNGDYLPRIGTRVQLLEQEYCYSLKVSDTEVKTFIGKGMEYYVNGIENVYSVGRDIRTRITLSRGMPIITENGKNHPVKEYLKYVYSIRIDVGKEYLYQQELSRAKKLKEEAETKKKLEEAKTIPTAPPKKDLKNTKPNG